MKTIIKKLKCRPFCLPAILILTVFLFIELSFAGEHSPGDGSQADFPLPSYGKKTEEANKSYSVEETTELLQSRKIGKLILDHNDHVYKCMKIAQEGKDIEGAVAALAAFKTNLGDTLDDDEVTMIIEISKLNTESYHEMARLAKKFGKKKTTVKEHMVLLDAIKKESIKIMLNGFEIAAQYNYKMVNDYFSEKRVKLLMELGKIKDEERFFSIYDAMRKVGMSRKMNAKKLEFLHDLYTLKGDVADKIVNYLKINKWKSRKQPGKREYDVIRDLMQNNYATFYNTEKTVSKTTVIKKPKKTSHYIRKKSYKKSKKKYVSVNKSRAVKKKTRKCCPCIPSYDY